MPRHILLLVLLIVACGVAALAAKRFFTVDSFYQYGHYRGKSVADIASDKPKYKGTAYCQPCHAQRFAEWSKGVHNSAERGNVVKCEVCHGPAGWRDDLGMFVNASTGPDHPGKLKLVIPDDTRRLCTLCHERMAGRPQQQPQIVVADHAGTQQCITCHDPHSPKIASAAVPSGDATAGKTKGAACAGCHGAEGVSVDLPGPSLAGQSQAYLVESFKAYTTGARANPMMGAVAQAASAEDMADLAAYFAGLKCQSTLTAEKQAADPGRAAAAQCIGCHGADGRSANSAFPNLIGMSKVYVAESAKAYRSGSRKNPMMAGIAKALADAEINVAASYYAGANCR
jgi:cytochrome c553